MMEHNLTENRKTLRWNTKTMVKIAVLSVIAAILMYFEFPLWFAPPFYEIDFSEVVVLIGGFSLGPGAAVIIEFLKIMIKLVLKSTMTAGIGDLANFLIGCALVVPASLIYKHRKSLKSAIVGMAAGTLCMTVLGSAMNAYVLLPFYATVFSGGLDAIIAMGNAVNQSITNITSFVFLAVVPFNALKGIVVSLVTALIYKRVSPILHR